MIWALAILSLCLAAWVARLHTLLRRAAQPRKVLLRKDQPLGELFIKPVALITGGNSFAVVHDPGNGEQPQRIAFEGVEASRWDLAIDTERATARLCCWLDKAEIWKPVEVQ